MVQSGRNSACDGEVCVNGLIIRSPRVEKILDRKKTWEMRGEYTHIRGKIALIRGGSGLVVGTCNLADVKGSLTHKEFQKNRRKAGLTASEAGWLPYGSHGAASLLRDGY